MEVFYVNAAIDGLSLVGRLVKGLGLRVFGGVMTSLYFLFPCCCCFFSAGPSDDVCKTALSDNIKPQTIVNKNKWCSWKLTNVNLV